MVASCFFHLHRFISWCFCCWSYCLETPNQQFVDVHLSQYLPKPIREETVLVLHFRAPKDGSSSPKCSGPWWPWQLRFVVVSIISDILRIRFVTWAFSNLILHVWVECLISG
jgi:hypothetical protein